MFGNQIVYSGSEVIFGGEFFDMQGVRYYRDYWLSEFKFLCNDKYYIEIGGKLCWCKELPNKIYRFATLNGQRIPNPVTEDDVRAAKMLLCLIMVVSFFLKGNILFMVAEVIYYLMWADNKKNYGEERKYRL